MSIYLGNTEIQKIYIGSTEIPKAYLGSVEVYGSGPGPEPSDYSKQYFTLKALENGHFGWNVESMLYSLNGGAWTAWPNSTGLDVSANDEVRFKDNAGRSGYGNFTITATGNFEVYGNSMSLFSVYGDNFSGATSFPSTNGGEFLNLFSGNTKLVSAENLVLPATSLNENSYRSLFYGCTNLTVSPVLPATTLGASCYRFMFQNCSSLTIAPTLPATELKNLCYHGMFMNCTSLTTAPALPATTAYTSCYYQMFQGCTALTAAPNLPATTLATGCYRQMFYGCSNLTTAPATLPATAATDNCYYQMFMNSALTTAPTLPATTLGASCYRQMFQGCENLTVAPAILPATTLATECYYSMFYGCKSLITPPDLPARTLVARCYYQMFETDKKINYIKCLAEDISADKCTYYWIYLACASTGTFVKSPNMNSWTTGVNGIKSGWTVVDAT